MKKRQLAKVRKDIEDEYRIVEEATFQRLRKALVGKKVSGGPKLKKGDTLSAEYLNELDSEDWFKLRLVDNKLSEQLENAGVQ